jgi:uncharacterized protein
MYAGGPVERVLELLSPDVVWRVPGASPIAGEHRGREQVGAYFERRRQLADRTMEMHPGEAMVAGEALAQFVAGSAVLAGERVSWQTIGAYRVDLDRGLISEVSLVPLDGDLFDRIWSVGS